MKKLTLSILVVSLISCSAFAQGSLLRLGIEGGANMDKISGQSFEQQFNFNYYLGAYANIGLTKGFGIQPEVVFSQSSATTSAKFSTLYSGFFNNGSEAGQQRQASLNYLSIPILASFQLVPRLYLQVGPQFGILLNHNQNLVDNGDQAFKNGDFSMVGGLWLRLPLHLNLMARYVVGMTNINNLGDQDRWTKQTIQLGVGLTL